MSRRTPPTDPDLQLAAMWRYDLRSNAILGFHDGAIHINGRRIIGFEGHDRVAFVMLSRYAQLEPGKAVSAAKLVALIDEHRRALSQWNWSLPRSPEAIYQAMKKLRRVLLDADVDPHIIESTDAGYRVGVPAMNIDLVFP